MLQAGKTATRSTPAEMSSRIVIGDCLWLRSTETDRAPYFRWLVKALEARGARLFVIQNFADQDGLRRLKDILWRSDVHVIIDLMLDRELKALFPIFKDRKNYSLAMMDWWTSSFWYKQHAEYLLFRNYNGIAARMGMADFAQGQLVPWFSLPDIMAPFPILGAMGRLPALALAPLIEVRQWWQRRHDRKDRSRLLYFPFTISPDQVPLKDDPPEYDFTNVSGTNGYWVMRDAYAPARYTCANLYADRRRLVNLILRLEHQPYRVFDLRRQPGTLAWDRYCDVVRKSRYGIATGGLHQASLPKVLEQICLGTPIIGPDLPFEFPWLKDCLFPVDPMQVKASELKPLLERALERHASLRQNCLAIREKLLGMYSPDRLLDLLQAQIDGEPIPSGYLKPEVAA